MIVYLVFEKLTFKAASAIGGDKHRLRSIKIDVYCASISHDSRRIIAACRRS